MKTFTIIIAVIAAIACALTIAVADDWMIVTTDEGAQQFNLANVESITFSREPDGLVAYYPFNGNADDESGNGLHGSVRGATLTRDRHGNANSAYHFIAANRTTIDVADNGLLDTGDGEDVTVNVWVKTNANQEMTIAAKYRSVPPRGGFYFVCDANGDPIWCGRDRNDARDSGPSDVGIFDGEWHMVTGMRQGTVWSVWVDGQMGNSADVGSSAAMDNDEILVIGCHIDVGQRAGYWEGDIDDVRIFNCALTADEIMALFNEE